MPVYLTVQGNTAPAIDLSLRYKRSRQPIDLTDASSVDFIIQNIKTKAITNAGHQSCTVTDAANGSIIYEVQDGDFPNYKTDYRCEVKITYADSTKHVVYDQLIVAVRPPIEEVS